MEQDYWEERTKKYGHTGWSSSIIYAFDNPIRIRVVDYLLNTILRPDQRSCLLDFGCGTGEFSKAQMKSFKRIVIYDKCNSVLETAKKSMKEVTAYNSFEQLEQEKSDSFDVILSITVLQHIIDPEEMESVISLLYKKLKRGGYLLVLESFAQVDVSNSYEKSWNYSEFVQMMRKTGFKLYNAYNYYETDVYSEKKYQDFSERGDVVLLGRIYAHVPVWIKKKILLMMQRISFIKGNLDHVEEYLYPISDRGISKFVILMK